MALKTELALEALKDALVAASAGGTAFPICTRNDDVTRGFTDAGGGLGWRLFMQDGNIRAPGSELGDGDSWELAVEADFVIAVEGEPDAGRDARLAGALEAIAAVLFPTPDGLMIDGKFDGIDIVTEVTRKHVPPEDGRHPIAAWEFTVALLLTAPTPFG